MSDAELQEALVSRLRLLSRDEPDLTSDVRSAQRARLVAMAAVRPTGAAAVRPTGAAAVRTPEARPSRWQRLVAARAADAPVARWRTRLTAGMAGAALVVGALSGLVALAQDAEPGDLLYGLKRGSEETRVALASDADRGLTLLGFASTRLEELTDLTGAEAGAFPVTVGGVDGSGLAIAAAGVDADTVVGVLATMDEQTTEGTSWLTTTAVQAQDPSAFGVLSGWTEGQRAGLAGLVVPAGAEAAVAASVALVDEVAARGAALQAALACPDGAASAGADSLGPVPGACRPATAPTDPAASATPADPAVPAVPDSPAVPAPTAGDQGPATSAPAGQTTSPAGTTGGAAPASPAAPTGVPQLPTVPTTGSPLVEVPVPLTTTICVGGLVCVGG